MKHTKLAWSLAVIAVWLLGYGAYYFGVPWEFYTAEATGRASRVDMFQVTLVCWAASAGVYVIGCVS